MLSFEFANIFSKVNFYFIIVVINIILKRFSFMINSEIFSWGHQCEYENEFKEQDEKRPIVKGNKIRLNKDHKLSHWKKNIEQPKKKYNHNVQMSLRIKKKKRTICLSQLTVHKIYKIFIFISNFHYYLTKIQTCV